MVEFANAPNKRAYSGSACHRAAMINKALPAGWVVSVTAPRCDDSSPVVQLYDAAIPCVVGAIQAVTSVAHAGPSAPIEALEGLSSSELVGLEIKPGEARLQWALSKSEKRYSSDSFARAATKSEGSIVMTCLLPVSVPRAGSVIVVATRR